MHDALHRSIFFHLATINEDERRTVTEKYRISLECREKACYQEIVQQQISTVFLVCPSFFRHSIQYRFNELFFAFLSVRIDLLFSNCQDYLPYSDVIDYTHPSSSLPWIYSIYFRNFEQRFHTLIAYLRTRFRRPSLPRETLLVPVKNQWMETKRFYYFIQNANLNFSQMPIGLMERIRFPSKQISPLRVEPNFYDQWNRLYQPFYRSHVRTHPFENLGHEELYTIVILTHKQRFYQLVRLLMHLNGLIHLHRVVVIFNQVDPLPSGSLSIRDFLGDYALYLPSMHVEIVYLFLLSNNLNDRFRPWNEFISTDCVLSLDDDSHPRHDEIEYGFNQWKTNRARLVGFIARSHRSKTLEYDAESKSCTFSMILTGAAFLHRWYFDFYTNVMTEEIRDYVKRTMNCEDIAMNYLVAHLTKQSPIKIGNRHSFECFKCEESLSKRFNHYDKRSECLKEFSHSYRSIPLRFSILSLEHLTNFTSCFEQ